MSSTPAARPRRRARAQRRLLEPVVIQALSSLESEAAADHPELPSGERSVVGRNRLLEVLSHIPDLDQREREFLAFYADPLNIGKSLGKLCSDFGLMPAHFVKLLARAEGARALMQALRIAAEHTPEVVAGAMTAAKITTEVCGGCQGGGAAKDSTPENYLPCGVCLGTGQVKNLPSVSRVKLALEVAGVVKAPGMTLNISNQAQAGAQAQAQAQAGAALVSGDVFDRFRSASQRVMRGILRPAGREGQEIQEEPRVQELQPATQTIEVESVFSGDARAEERPTVQAEPKQPQAQPQTRSVLAPPGRRPGAGDGAN